MPPRPRPWSGGQATVEFALALPLVVMALLLVVQIGLVARAQLLVAHAAREGARAAAVDGPGAAALAARRAPGLRSERIEVSTTGGQAGGLVTVTVRYRAPTEAPLVGALVGDPMLEASVTMRVEERLDDALGGAGP